MKQFWENFWPPFLYMQGIGLTMITVGGGMSLCAHGHEVWGSLLLATGIPLLISLAVAVL